jgi:hypothetical protein
VIGDVALPLAASRNALPAHDNSFLFFETSLRDATGPWREKQKNLTTNSLVRQSRSPNALTAKARKNENTKGRKRKFFNESIEGRRKKRKNIHFAFNRTVTEPTKLLIRRERLRESTQPSRDR